MCTPVIIKRWTEERTIGRSGAQLGGPDTGYYVESIVGTDRLQSPIHRLERSEGCIRAKQLVEHVVTIVD